MTRHSTSMPAPPPPSPEVAQSAAYRLPASTKALLVLLEAEIADQGGLIAAVDLDGACAASGMRRPALVAALDQLAEAGFIVASMRGRLCIVAPSTTWRRT
jgi:hypothetical protein